MGAPQYEQAGADIGGTGTTNTIPRWTGPSTLGDSIITQTGSTRITVGSGAYAGASVDGFRVANGTDSYIAASDGTRTLLMGANGAQVLIGSLTNHSLVVKTNNIDAITILPGAAGVGGNVGIGTASPLSLLHVRGSSASAVQAFIHNANGGTSSAAELVFGTYSGAIPTGAGNPGPQAKISAINTNVATAQTDLAFYTYPSTGAGIVERMRINSAGTQAQSQVAIGTSSFTSGRALTTVADLDVFGVRVGRGGGDDAESTALGAGALAAQTSGARHNTAVGKGAGASIQGGGWNVAIGNNALQAYVSANNSVAVGSSALYSATAGSNVAVGANALYYSTSGTTNCAIGAYCLFNLGTTSNNVAFGNESGRYFGAGSSALTAATDSIFLGADARASANSETNQIVIGKSAVGNGSNTVTIGNSSNVGTFLDTKYVRLVDSYTVATLPAAGTAGRIARVTDGDAGLAWGATVVNTGAGATPYLVWDNGTNWTVFGK